MPEDTFSIQADFDTFPSSLIIDEVGELSTVLVDGLLSQGCFVNYLGRESKDSFFYLKEKNNFCFLNSPEETISLKKINYLFYFPKEIEEPESEEKNIEFLNALCGKHNCKLLIACTYLNPNKERIFTFLKETKANARLVIFGDTFGPRVKSGFLGNLISLGLQEKNIHIPENPLTKFFPISSDILSGWLIRLIFSTDTKAKAFFLRTEPINFYEFNEKIAKILPKANLTFEEDKDIFQIDLGKTEAVKVEQDLEEKIEEAVQWLKRNQISFVNESLETKEKAEEISFLDSSNKGPETPTEKIIDTNKGEEDKRKEQTGKESKLDFLFGSKGSVTKESDSKKEDKSQESEQSQRGKQKENTSKPKKNSLPKKLIAGIIVYLFLFLFFFCGPLFFAGATGFVGIRYLQKTKEGITNGDLSSSYQATKSAEKYLSLSTKTLSLTGPFYALIGLGKQIQYAADLIEFAENLNDSANNLLQAGARATALSKNFINAESSRWEEELPEIKKNLIYAYDRASLSQSSLERLEKVFVLFKKESLFQDLKIFIPRYRELLLKSQSLVAVAPEMLGISERKNYLILFQNNMELRPTGGFIGSYAILGIENGKLVNFEVFDVYQADGQLKGHVEPPELLKKHLGEANWYLRDSNWDPDYPVSARRAQWFLDKEMQVSTDGAIAINIETARALLSVFGEVYLPHYDEKVNKENVFEKAEYYSELGTFPGSTQKKDFLGSLSRELLEKIKKSNQKELVNIVGALLRSAEEKEILFYFNNAKVQQAILNLNWGGEIRHFNPKSNTGTVFSDYLYINEANVGINKANFFVKRDIDHSIKIKENGKVEEKLTLTYENTSPSDNWPGGRYKTYLRIFLPQGTVLTSVLNTDPQNPNLWLPFDNSLKDEAMGSGKSIFGFIVEVPIKTTRKIEIKYELPESVDFSNKLISYLVLSQKQSGAYPSVYSLEVTYPSGFVPVRVIPSAVVGEDKLIISDKLNKDLIFQIDLVH